MTGTSFFDKFNFNFQFPTFWGSNLSWGSWNTTQSPTIFSDLNMSTFCNSDYFKPTFNFNYTPTAFTDFSYQTPSFMNNYSMNNSKVSFIPFLSDMNYSFGDSFVKKANYKVSKTTSSLDGYNNAQGEKLAKTALKNQVGFSNSCAKYVKDAIEDSGLGAYESGHGYQMDEILRKNPNFKELDVASVTNLNDLPAGCVLVYEKGKSGYSSTYGHTEITTGDGRGVSDGITNNLRAPSAIFYPV